MNHLGSDRTQPISVLPRAMALLERGARGQDAAFRAVTLATVAHGAPALRTMILRRVLPDIPALELHTDARSHKMAALQPGAPAAVHAWSEAARIQLRLTGDVAILDAAAQDAIWRALPDSTRRTYAVALPPGTPVASPGTARRDRPDSEARAAFVALHIAIASLEWLDLGADPYERARVTWDNGTPRATWLVP